MFYKEDELLALLPANLHGDVLASHGGLTFGGVLCDHAMTVMDMLDVFTQITEHARKRNLKSILYKAIPYPFSRMPAQEDLYALFRMDARLIRRDVSSVIALEARLDFAGIKRQCVAKAARSGLTVRESPDFESFMSILAYTLARHGAKPVHTLAEIQLLHSRFPNHMRLFAAFDAQATMLAGTLVYEYGRTAHTQYMANSEAGRKLAAQDLIIDFLVNHFYPSRMDYFSFGISTEQEGRFLNAGLCAQKEMFGGRAVAHDCYALDVPIERHGHA